MTALLQQRPRDRRGVFKAGIGTLAAGMLVWTTAAAAALPSQGYAELVEKVSPAVVFISSDQKPDGPKTMEHGPAQRSIPFPFPPGSPFEEFFKQFEDRAPQQHAPKTALGSGFIIDPDGYVVTNNHVVDNASRVRVKLPDGREFTATVVGTDAKTDLALLKIKAAKSLPAVKFGDSSRIRPGDVVLAVGNPFGLGGSVTAGIVSARNRDIHAGPYDDFIQTDAAINHGNSGGPLFNVGGEVVGVNTAIYSPNGGSVGIGFSIPSNLVADVVAQLKNHGNVDRGWLGVNIQMVSPEIADAIGLDNHGGALVSEVTPNSPAAAAGLRQGDVILSFDGKPVTTMRRLPRYVADTPAGKAVETGLWRNGNKMSVTVTIGKLKGEKVASTGSNPAFTGGTASTVMGADLATLDDAARAQLNLPAETKGVVIADVAADGRAAEAGLRPGDVIERVGATMVRNPADVTAALTGTKRSSVLLLINRGGNKLFVGMKLAVA